jgi:hypothetical protein
MLKFHFNGEKGHFKPLRKCSNLICIKFIGIYLNKKIGIVKDSLKNLEI